MSDSKPNKNDTINTVLERPSSNESAWNPYEVSDTNIKPAEARKQPGHDRDQAPSPYEIWKTLIKR